MAAGRGPFWEKLIRLLSAILVLDKFFVFSWVRGRLPVSGAVKASA